MKRLFDLFLALCAGGVLLLPVMIVAIAVRLTSRGPALYWSDRIGRDNRIFKMPKFRSMRVGTPAVATHLLSDPRVYLTPIGSFLRKSSLDELPQLWSILAGDMSFVGPRPALFNQHYLSRPSALTSFTSHDFRFSLPLAPHFQSASRFSVQSGDHDEQGKAIGPLLTDRYGFMYDIALYDVLLLIRARECGNSAPACLTGVKIADRVEDNSWPEDDDSKSIGTGSARGRSGEGIEVVKGECPCDGEADASSVVGEHVEELPSLDAQSSSAKSRSSSKSGRRSSSVLPSSATTASNTTNNGGTGRGSTSFAASILSVNDNTPRHACTKTIRKLLDQLTEIHDQQQAAQQKEWSIFVKQRSRVKPSSNKPSSSNQPTGPANTLLNSIGLGLSNDDADDADELGHTEGLINFAQLGNSTERREFDKLVRNGIPLCYRSKVWMECSGALELKEPGLFKDLLGATEKNGEELGSVVAEIEKDVGRTMPLNIFFGGDGAGVDKLRRVLIAYSR